MYVVREHADLTNVTRGNLMAGQPRSEENSSLEAELVQLTSHDHPLFRNDNGDVYDRMERALSVSNYSSTIVKFWKKREGDKAFKALVSQHDGKPVWEKRIKDAKTYLMNRKWMGTMSHTLEKHIDRHWAAFVSLSKATDHVSHQIPKNRTRVGYLIDSIESKDAKVFLGLAAIRQDDQGMRETFEQAAVFLAPTCPVANKLATKGKI